MRYLILLWLGLSFTFLQAQTIDPAQITIARDSFGVPHIFAKTDAEVAYGLAWATLEDESELPQWFLAATKGKLGAMTGIDGVKVDFAVAWMGVRDRVNQRYESDITPEYKKVLEAYAAGANAFAKAHPERITLKSLFPITPQDICVGHMLAFALIQGVDGTLRRIVDGRMPNPWNSTEEGLGVIDSNAKKHEGIGSNAFAMNSQITDDGNVFLALNAHQPVEGLMSWYEAHVCSEEGMNIHGAMFHGGNTPYIGTNPYLGWAHTSGGYDGVDVFALEMHPKKKNMYKFDGEWLKLEQHKVKLVVGLGKKHKTRIPVWRKVWWSKFGPTYVAENGVFAVRMGSIMKITPSQQWYYMCKATNFTEFRKALDMQALAHYNIIYGDKNDTVYYLANGLIPQRAAGHNWGGVVKGNSSEVLWDEFYPVKDLVQFLNPKSGYVFNTNNSAFMGTDKAENLDPKDFDPYMSYDTEENNRSTRFYELMEGRDKLSFQDFWDIKYDTRFPRDFKDLRGFKVDGLFSFKPEDQPDLAEAIRHINAWDRGTEMENPDFPVVATALYYINEHFRPKDQQDAAAWREKMLEAIRFSQTELMEHFGTLDLTTGDVQRIVRGDVNLPLGGGPDILRAVYTEKFQNGTRKIWIGDSYMQLVRFTPEGPEIWSLNTFGASNQPDSPHYTDQMEMYSQKKMRKVTLDKEEVLKSAERVYHPE
ncbi:MAG: penicillin acylase family protein [Bacteroidia bacterium]|nr:penicillin acylase family protein [Bacteroidia bacterium]